MDLWIRSQNREILTKNAKGVNKGKINKKVDD